MARGAHQKRSASVQEDVRKENRKHGGKADLAVKAPRKESTKYIPEEEAKENRKKAKSREEDRKENKKDKKKSKSKSKKRKEEEEEEEEEEDLSSDEEEDPDQLAARVARDSRNRASSAKREQESSDDEEESESEKEEEEEEEEEAPKPKPISSLSTQLKLQLRAAKTEAEKEREKKERKHSSKIHRNAALRKANTRDRRAVKYFSGRKVVAEAKMRNSSFRRMVVFAAPADTQVTSSRGAAMQLLCDSIKKHLVDVIQQAQESRLIGRKFKSDDKEEEARLLEILDEKRMKDVLEIITEKMHPGLLPIMQRAYAILIQPLDERAAKSHDKREHDKFIKSLRDDVDNLVRAELTPAVWEQMNRATQLRVQESLVRKSNFLHIHDIEKITKRIEKAEKTHESIPARVRNLKKDVREALTKKREEHASDGHHRQHKVELHIAKVAELVEELKEVKKRYPNPSTKEEKKAVKEAEKALKAERRARDRMIEMAASAWRLADKARSRLAGIDEKVAKEQAKGERALHILNVDYRTSLQKADDEMRAKREKKDPPKPIGLRQLLENKKRELALGRKKAHELKIADVNGEHLYAEYVKEHRPEQNADAEDAMRDD